MEHTYALILAGGGGTRLWPMSRKDTPKQLLPLMGDHSMYEVSVRRLEPLFAPERIFVVTGGTYVDAMRAETPEIPPENFIVEPAGRDSGPAVALGVAAIQHRDPQAVVAVLTADHYIAKPELFREALAVAAEIARDEGYIVTLGIAPTYPATGFGYIKQGAKLRNGLFPAHVAERFTEKPDVVKATKFVASGKYSWNSGMFIMTTQALMAELERQQPEMFRVIRAVAAAMGGADASQQLMALWPQMPKLSIDYAVMEGARRMAVIPVDIGWSDVGSWASLFDLLERDKFGNYVKGRRSEGAVMLDSENTLLFTDRLAVTIGVEDIIVVETEDVLMICHRNRTQDVKQVVEYLKQNGQSEYL